MVKYHVLNTDIKFDFLKNVLTYLGVEHDLDEIRNYLLTHHKELCHRYKIKAIDHSGKFVTRSLIFINGTPARRKEIEMGRVQVIYDWDALLSHAGKLGIIKNYLIGQN